MDRRWFLTIVFATTAAVAGPAGAWAQGSDAGAASYPNRAVTIVVPFSAGSQTDILARSVAEKLAERWKQNVIVENRPGIAGTAGVAKAAPDGYTLMLTSNGHTVIKAVNPAVAFDPVKDFVGISQVASTPSILVVPPNSKNKTLKDLIEEAKANPGVLNYSSAGLGSSTGIAAELFKNVTKTSIIVVPHRGLPESQTAVLRGDVAMAFTFFNVGGDLIQGGKLRALAVTGSKRMSQLHDVPTFAEAGLPEFTYDSWFGVMAPAGTPQAIVDKVSKDIAAAVQAPDMKARFDPQGAELVSSTPEKFNEAIRRDAERYGALFPKQQGSEAKQQ
jgi:tripartite-type tricarboxylate transporter receptor subunit TctC